MPPALSAHQRSKRRSAGPLESSILRTPEKTAFSDADLINANQKLTELHTVFAGAVDTTGRLATLAERISTLQSSFQRLRISLQQANRPFEGYDGFQRTLLSCDLFIRYFRPAREGQSWSCDGDHVARLEAEIMMQVSLLSTSTIVLLAETFFNNDDIDPEVTKPTIQRTISGSPDTARDPEIEELWKKIKRVVYGRKRKEMKLLPQASKNTGPATALEKEVQNDLRQLMLNHQPAIPDAITSRTPHIPERSQLEQTSLNLEALPDEALLERTQQHERFLRTASGQPVFPRAVQTTHFAPNPPARVYTLPDDYDSNLAPERSLQHIIDDGIISINLPKPLHYKLSRVKYRIIDKKRKIECRDIDENVTIIHDLPSTFKRYPITLHPEAAKRVTGAPSISFHEALQVEVHSRKQVNGTAFITYHFSHPENVKLFQEIIRDKDLLHTAPADEITSSSGKAEASYQNIKIWKDPKTLEYTLSFCRNLIPNKPQLELPLSSFELGTFKKPRNDRTIRLDISKGHSLSQTSSHDSVKDSLSSSSPNKRMSVISVGTTQTNATMKHKERMEEVGKALQHLTVEFRTHNDAIAFKSAFITAKEADMADPVPSPYGSPVGVFGNPSPFSSPILEQSTPRGSVSSYMPTPLPEPADEVDPIIGTPPRSSVTASRSRSASQVRGVSRSRSNSLIRNEINARTCEDYTVGWICALSVEMAAAIAMLDDRHPRLPQDWRDKNAYEIGRIGDHNVVITCLPAGMTGNNSSASVATRMAYSFPNISIRLMVGIGGGVPSAVDVRLGDVVVSKPGLNDGGVVQYDFGKTTSGGIFEKTGSLPPPPPALLSAISRLAAIHGNFGSEIPEFLKAFDSEFLKTGHQYPGPSQDILFLASYDHVDRFAFDCSACDHTQVQSRPQRGTDPVVHYGTIASGNQVMRDARTRDELGKKYGVLCFDMEAAGLMNTFPCIVIRGICDYADTHKNKMWQGYAAATAACYAKELLLSIPPSQGHERGGSTVGLGFLGGWGGLLSAPRNTNPSSL